MPTAFLKHQSKPFILMLITFPINIGDGLTRSVFFSAERTVHRTGTDVSIGKKIDMIGTIKICFVFHHKHMVFSKGIILFAEWMLWVFIQTGKFEPTLRGFADCFV